MDSSHQAWGPHPNHADPQTGDTRDSPDGLAPVTPQGLPDGVHAHLELAEAELLEERAVAGVLAGCGHKEGVHCNESVQGPSANPRPPSSASPAHPRGAWPRAHFPLICGEEAWGSLIQHNLAKALLAACGPDGASQSSECTGPGDHNSPRSH